VSTDAYVRTTINLREDLYQLLKRYAKKKGLSSVINEFLAEKLKRKETLFGTMPKVSTADLRDEKERI